MTEHDWLTSDDPGRMLEHLRAMNSAVGVGVSPYPVPHTSDRKLRLFACACARTCWKNGAELRAILHCEGVADTPGVRWNPAVAGEENWSSWHHGVLRRGRSKAAIADILRDIVGNPFRSSPIPSNWLTPDVLSLAQAAYEVRSGRVCQKCHGKGGWKRCNGCDGEWAGDAVQAPCFVCGHPYLTQKVCPECQGEGRLDDGTLDPARLAVLSDSLEEAGCTEESLLRHLRGWRSCYYCHDNPAIDRDRNEWCTYCGHERWLKGDFGTGPHYRGCWVLDLILGRE